MGGFVQKVPTDLLRPRTLFCRSVEVRDVPLSKECLFNLEGNPLSRFDVHEVLVKVFGRSLSRVSLGPFHLCPTVPTLPRSPVLYSKTGSQSKVLTKEGRSDLPYVCRWRDYPKVTNKGEVSTSTSPVSTFLLLS